MTRPYTEMELRCTQAAAKAAWEATDSTPGLVLMVRGVNIAAVVRATIRAMNVPTAEMFAAEDVHKSCQTCGGAAELWPLMIDAASPPEGI